MACIRYNILWESEFDNIISQRNKPQDLKINQLKFEVHAIYEKNEKITTKFEPVKS